MDKIEKTSEKSPKKTRSKQKWREIEAIRDRYQLIKELQDDDYSLEMDLEEINL